MSTKSVEQALGLPLAMLFAILLATLCASGCLRGPTRLHPGPARPRDEIAVLRVDRLYATRVYAVDGQRTFGREWHLAPGRHAVWIRAQMREPAGYADYTIWTYCLYDMLAEAGHAYSVESTSRITQRTALGKHGEVGATILDESGSPVFRSLECIGDRPSLD